MPDVMERFWSKVNKTETCWLWTAGLDAKGYGKFWADGQNRAHRWLFERVVSSVDPGHDLDHLCRNRACVNPAHLEPVTHAENMARGAQATATHCQRGHEFTEANTIVLRNQKRTCRACAYARIAAYRQRKAAA